MEIFRLPVCRTERLEMDFGLALSSRCRGQEVPFSENGGFSGVEVSRFERLGGLAHRNERKKGTAGLPGASKDSVVTEWMQAVEAIPRCLNRRARRLSAIQLRRALMSGLLFALCV